MSQRKERAARKAARRSETATASRVARKVAHAESTELDREFNAELAKIVRDRDAALVAAAETHRKTVAVAREELQAARREAWTAYDEARTKLLKQLAPKVAA